MEHKVEHKVAHPIKHHVAVEHKTEHLGHFEHKVEQKKHIEHKSEHKIEHKVERKQHHHEKKQEEHKEKKHGHEEQKHVSHIKVIPVVVKHEKHIAKVAAPAKIIPIAQYVGNQASKEHDHKHHEHAISSQHISRHDVPAPPPKGFSDHSVSVLL